MGRLEDARELARELAHAAAGDSPADLGRKAWSMGLGRLYLRRCSSVGRFTSVHGRPRVVNDGVLTIGRRVVIWSTVVPSELLVFPGGRLEIGDDTFMNYGTSIAATGSVRIGERCLLGMYTIILDNDFHELDARTRRPAPRPVVLEDNVWLGHRVLVLPGVTIGRDAVVGAGSVVTADIPPRSMALGNPARVVRTF